MLPAGEWAYATLALGSALALFMYPHSVTGVFAARQRDVIRRNAAMLPAYTLLLGGIWILQTFPAIVIGLYTRWFHRRALFIGWAAGMAYGTTVAYRTAGGGQAHFGASAAPVFGHVTYIALTALALNIAVATALTPVCRKFRLQDGYDATRPGDYTADPGSGQAAARPASGTAAPGAAGAPGDGRSRRSTVSSSS